MHGQLGCVPAKGNERVVPSTVYVDLFATELVILESWRFRTRGTHSSCRYGSRRSIDQDLEDNHVKSKVVCLHPAEPCELRKQHPRNFQRDFWARGVQSAHKTPFFSEARDAKDGIPASRHADGGLGKEGL